MTEPPAPLLKVFTPIGLLVRTTEPYWVLLQLKHPEIRGRLADVERCLAAPDQVRQSKQDAAVYLFYRRSASYHLCVVVKRLDGQGFVVTCYITDAIKEGTAVWPTSG